MAGESWLDCSRTLDALSRAFEVLVCGSETEAEIIQRELTMPISDEALLVWRLPRNRSEEKVLDRFFLAQGRYRRLTVALHGMPLDLAAEEGFGRGVSTLLARMRTTISLAAVGWNEGNMEATRACLGTAEQLILGLMNTARGIPASLPRLDGTIAVEGANGSLARRLGAAFGLALERANTLARQFGSEPFWVLALVVGGVAAAGILHSAAEA